VSAERMRLTILATELAEAVAKDQQPEHGGCDVSAGMFGPNASDWLRERERDNRDAVRWRKLRAQCGYWQNGSDTTVTLSQDDATRSCFIKVGKQTYGTDGSTIEGLVDQHFKEDDNL
jgi:hypothetical protein